MTPNEAYELVVYKWTKIIKILQKPGFYNQREVSSDICSDPKLINFPAGCAYCKIYNIVDDHVGCPLFINNQIDCMSDGHPFTKFYFAPSIKTALKYAKELLELIIKTKPE